jgi:hypothetical protein
MKPCFLILLLGFACATVRPPEPSSGEARAGIDAFNHALDDATRKMDNAAALALWESGASSARCGTRPVSRS